MQGLPQPAISWTHNGVLHTFRANETDKSILTIRYFDESDEGSYKCIADNGIGEPVSREYVVYGIAGGKHKISNVITMFKFSFCVCRTTQHHATLDANTRGKSGNGHSSDM